MYRNQGDPMRLWEFGTASCFSLAFFFFQAEDGIRDLIVTGVQTCALPIFERGQRARDAAAPARKVLVEVRDATEVRMAQHARRAPGRRSAPVVHGDGLRQIGRASCRERV